MPGIQESTNQYNLNLFLSPCEFYTTTTKDDNDEVVEVYHITKLGDHFYAFCKVEHEWDGVAPILGDNLEYDDVAKEWKGEWIDGYIVLLSYAVNYTNKIGCFRRKIRFQKGLSKLLSLIDSNNSYIDEADTIVISKKLSDIVDKDSENNMKIIHKILETSFKGHRFINKMDDIYFYNEKSPMAEETQNVEVLDENNTKGDFFTFTWNNKNPGIIDSENSIIYIKYNEEDVFRQSLSDHFSKDKAYTIGNKETIKISVYDSEGGFDPNKTTTLKLNNKKVIIDDEFVAFIYDEVNSCYEFTFDNFDFGKYNNTNGLIKISISQK